MNSQLGGNINHGLGGMFAGNGDEELYMPIQDADKADFVCIMFKDSSMYYGQIIWVGPEG